MNSVNISGNLTRDPESREVVIGGKETTVTNFTVAVNRYWKKKDGTNGQDTEYVDCEAWDSGAKTIRDIMSKGDPVIVIGSLKQDSWVDKEGNKRSKLKVRVDKFEKLYRRATTEDTQPVSEEPTPVTEEVPQQVGAGEDIPF